MSPLRGSAHAVANELAALASRRRSALVVFGIVGVTEERSFEAALRAALSARSADLGAVELVFDAGGGCADALRELNAARDLLLPRAELVVVAARDLAGLRVARSLAPDLASFASLGLEVEEEAPPLSAVLGALLRLAAEENADLDLGALVGEGPGQIVLRLEAVYVDLIRPDQDRSSGLAAKGSGEAWSRGPDRLLALVGNPGSGKSTWLRHLAIELASGKDTLRMGVRTPILISLPALSQARERVRGGTPLLEVVGWMLEERGVRGARRLATAPDQIVLLLDGLDELPDRRERRALLDELSAVPTLSVVVTTRFHTLEDVPGQFSVLLPRPMSRRSRRLLLDRFFLARGRAEGADELERVLRRHEELDSLTATPLLLVMLALVFDLEGQLPERRSALYRRFAETLLERWDAIRRRRTPAPRRVRPRAGEARRVAATIAWNLVSTGRTSLSEDELRSLLAEEELAHAGTADRASERVDEQMEILRSGGALLTAHGQGHWGFVHASIADWFAGQELARGGARWRAVIADPFAGRWIEVLAFCAGELGERGDDDRLTQLATALSRRHPLGGRYAAVHGLALIACLREDPGFSAVALDALLTRLIEVLFRNRLYPRGEQALAGALLDLVQTADGARWRAPLRAAMEPAIRNLIESNPAARLPLIEVLPEALGCLGGDAEALLARLLDSPDDAVREVARRHRRRRRTPR